MNFKVFTIGHSNHPLQEFLGLLKKYGITLVVDIRSHPYSRYVPHFNRESLAQCLCREGIGYVFLGECLGGRPREKEYYRADNKVDYELLRQSPRFREGIEQVKRLAAQHRLTLLCSEANPSNCHRKLLVGQTLEEEGFEVVHIGEEEKRGKAAPIPKEGFQTVWKQGELFSTTN
ncbi:MAG: DUF488 domain-containing protein [Candidatus Caldatribacterium sp.]|uniref:DUF488 domain-containing protein n=1 Tax=Candidatus Caldatribacterium sp. TaxID=2282143 RepID=UPI00299B9BB8|nr:DUF488 domain-containing protein [Candidatus Caldatribacterium sp.]MCX7730725.1 DUF488 domain-containing protein [Candidatus Caldatribacterium sp.]MDW8082105.1 DUF488 domain-containing protein [Candidatus Calescibacterium sp.]